MRPVNDLRHAWKVGGGDALDPQRAIVDRTAFGTVVQAPPQPFRILVHRHRVGVPQPGLVLCPHNSMRGSSSRRLGHTLTGGTAGLGRTAETATTLTSFQPSSRTSIMAPSVNRLACVVIGVTSAKRCCVSRSPAAQVGSPVQPPGCVALRRPGPSLQSPRHAIARDAAPHGIPKGRRRQIERLALQAQPGSHTRRPTAPMIRPQPQLLIQRGKRSALYTQRRRSRPAPERYPPLAL